MLTSVCHLANEILFLGWFWFAKTVFPVHHMYYLFGLRDWKLRCKKTNFYQFFL